MDWAARPLTPVSTSSKIRTGMASVRAKILFIASIIRDNSPPEAILPSGRSGSPGFGEIMNSALSIPCRVRR
ncbi:hypothetical protein D3C73_1512020 [compost metagenome]